MQSLAIGIDLGCTNIKGVLIDTEGNILQESKVETNEQDDSHWKRAVLDMIHDFKKKAEKEHCCCWIICSRSCRYR